MKRQLLIIGFLSATLIFLIKLFETRFLSGEFSIKVYVSLIGLIFLAIGIWFGLHFTKREASIPIVEKEPEINMTPNQFLTDRETELLTIVAQGFSNKEIADKLFISEHTVKKHLNNIYTKLEVTRRTQAIPKARKLGIISA